MLHVNASGLNETTVSLIIDTLVGKFICTSSNSTVLCPEPLCKRTDCPDCTNANLLSVENNETCSTKVASEILTPIRVIQTDPREISIAVQDDTEDDSIPNWLSMWSEEQISCWQKADPDIKIIFELKSLHLAKPPKSVFNGVHILIAIDILGTCPVTRNANEYLIVITDYFTKWTESFAVSNHTALTVADKLVTEVFCRFGVPSQLHSDQGREFMSDLFTQICILLNIDKTRTCPYRPQSDGLVDRINRTLIQMLSIFVNDNRNDWDDHLPYLLMAYRSTIQDSTGFAPHKLLFGRDMMCPIDIISGFMPKNENILCPVQYVEWVKHTLSLTYKFVNSNLNRAASRQKKNYDRGAKPRAFEEGSFVWRWYPPKAGLKLALGWTGPYHVEKKLSDVLYKIRLLPDRRFLVVHVDHLKPYTGLNKPNGWEIEESEFDNSFVELPDETENIDFADDLNSSTEISSLNTPDARVTNHTPVDDKPVTPPRRTRCGRSVKKPIKYSPSL
ncbi:unnamed protein product [Mytilus coruscus]|uniref:Integrase catalytic domain-containing protein n=1 Tax=Mytilus coruscus TaxID=42192 RepID=A0A6J8AYC9_MYTCO|nr:unnamed protein product [Mytilus coruscus]